MAVKGDLERIALAYPTVRAARRAMESGIHAVTTAVAITDSRMWTAPGPHVHATFTADDGYTIQVRLDATGTRIALVAPPHPDAPITLTDRDGTRIYAPRAQQPSGSWKCDLSKVTAQLAAWRRTDAALAATVAGPGPVYLCETDGAPVSVQAGVHASIPPRIEGQPSLEGTVASIREVGRMRGELLLRVDVVTADGGHHDIALIQTRASDNR